MFSYVWSKMARALGVVLLFGFLIIGIQMMASAETPADELARQAMELRLQARRGHCEQIAERITKAYAGDKNEWPKIAESSKFFLDTYGQTHDVACVSDTIPFGSGGR